MKTIKSNCTDAELNAAVAEHVAGIDPVCHCGDLVRMHHMGSGHSPVPMEEPFTDYSTSTDSVLPLLESRAMVVEISYCSIGCTWSVTITGHKTQWRHTGDSNECLAKVICFALLKAKGWTVVKAP